MPPAADIIAVSPVGRRTAALAPAVCKAIEHVYGRRTRVVPLLDSLDFAYDAQRGQFHSTPILERLAALAPQWALRVLAITTDDLFIPILTHVYGEAQLGGTAAIVSIHRLSEGLPALDADAVFNTRLAKEAVHELGHTFDLRHCKDKACSMHYCRSLFDVDQKKKEMCRYCAVLLGDAFRRLGLDAGAQDPAGRRRSVGAAASGPQKKP
jgi:archaemetzincin